MTGPLPPLESLGGVGGALHVPSRRFSQVILEGGIGASSMMLVYPDEGDGFRVEADGRVLFEAVASGAGWSVERAGAPGEAWALRRDPEAPGGLVLVAAEEAGAGELGRATALGGEESGGAEVTILAGDGRLFRAGFRTGRRPGYRLTGWEAPGAYLEAETSEAGWTIRKTPAGEALEGDEAIVVLFAAVLAFPY